MAVACCAADARPVKVIVDTDAPSPPADTWIAVTGTSSPPEHNVAEGYPEPVIVATDIELIPEPPAPYGG